MKYRIVDISNEGLVHVQFDSETGPRTVLKAPLDQSGNILSPGLFKQWLKNTLNTVGEKQRFETKMADYRGQEVTTQFKEL